MVRREDKCVWERFCFLWGDINQDRVLAFLGKKEMEFLPNGIKHLVECVYNEYRKIDRQRNIIISVEGQIWLMRQKNYFHAIHVKVSSDSQCSSSWRCVESMVESDQSQSMVLRLIF